MKSQKVCKCCSAAKSVSAILLDAQMALEEFSKSVKELVAVQCVANDEKSQSDLNAVSWKPKVGDWVRVTKPKNFSRQRFPSWDVWMHRFDGMVGQIEFNWLENCFQVRGFVDSNGCQCSFHSDWLSPAEPPQQEEPSNPPEPEYRQPVLPWDAGKQCEFSDDGEEWQTETLVGFSSSDEKAPWESENCLWEYARIEKGT